MHLAQERKSDRASGYNILHIQEAFKYEATLDNFKEVLGDLELCRRTIAAKKEARNAEHFDHTVELMTRIQNAFFKDVEDDAWCRVKGTSVGSDLACYEGGC